MNVGQVLARNGYTTGYVGKFHVGPELKQAKEYEEHGLKYVPRDARLNEAVNEAFRHNERWYSDYMKQRGFSWAKHIYWGNLQNPFNHHNPEWTIEAALEFIEENREGPFYLHYCTTLLHGPDKSWRVSMDHPTVSGEGTLDELPDVMTDRKVLLEQLDEKGLDPEAGHAGNTWVDDSVGAVLEKLDELGIADNTLVVFIADHGSKMKGSLFTADGVNVPCIMRWPEGIKAAAECDEMIQNIDFAPTFFDLAGADVPESYIIDGRSLTPLFQGEKPATWRDYLYFEMGSARAICTKDWKYVAVRYSKEQIEKIRKSAPENLPRDMSYIGRTGIGVRGASHPGFFDPDQLYYLRQDGMEMKNLARNPEHAARLAQMRETLTEAVKALGRPFGEFAPGGNASPAGLVDEQVEYVKKIRIQGKNVILPDGAAAKDKAADSPAEKKAAREDLRAERKREKKAPPR
jgi:arylsulfatase A-like enzyme